uniref:Uncharacterized protein n=1 Tax=Marmota marmota marmota TaxID=9994 RepID=A0A8C5ZHH7_MARMA
MVMAHLDPGAGVPPTWLPQHRQVGLPTGQVCVAERHDAVLGSFIEAKHSLLRHPVPTLTLTDGVHPRDHLILAQVLTGLIVRHGLSAGLLPLGAASIWAGWTLLTCLPKGSGLCALALPTDAVPTVATDLPILGLARADVC